MDRLNRWLIVTAWTCTIISSAALGLAQSNRASQSQAIVVPRIWDSKELAGWAVPIAGVNTTPNFYTEEEYYSAPVENLRTYPVYHPDKEPKDYMEWLKKQGPQPMIEPEKLKTEKDWIEAGRQVFDQLDIPIVRTSDERAFAFLRNREAMKQLGTTITGEGQILAFRYVVDKSGVKLGLSECASCHNHVLADGTLIRGAQGNVNLGGGGEALGILVSGFAKAFGEDGKPASPNWLAYSGYGVPWLKDDIHEKMKTMHEEELSKVDGVPMPGTFPRFNGSPYFITKIPDLIGIKERRYLDHTATHLNRGPADIARYAALVSYADDGSIGPHRFLSESQRKLKYRFSDEALYALGMYIYSIEPPPNPNKFDPIAQRGKKVFEREGCASCHTPPFYTNNKLMPIDGFKPPASHLSRFSIMSMSVGTSPDLALKTRKGTGYYKVPSLKGLWYRTLIEHSGSIASLENWFDRKRLRDDFVPDGWKGPGVAKRAIKGHEFGLDLSSDDKRSLIAFLKTL
jgi:hypothetical protein